MDFSIECNRRSIHFVLFDSNLETKGSFVGDDVECFNYADLKEMMKEYNPAKLKGGFNLVNGEDIFYISNPATGLWAYKERFK